MDGALGEYCGLPLRQIQHLEAVPVLHEEAGFECSLPNEVSALPVYVCSGAYAGDEVDLRGTRVNMRKVDSTRTDVSDGHGNAVSDQCREVACMGRYGAPSTSLGYAESARKVEDEIAVVQ